MGQHLLGVNIFRGSTFLGSKTCLGLNIFRGSKTLGGVNIFGGSTFWGGVNNLCGSINFFWGGGIFGGQAHAIHL